MKTRLTLTLALLLTLGMLLTNLVISMLWHKDTIRREIFQARIVLQQIQDELPHADGDTTFAARLFSLHFPEDERGGILLQFQGTATTTTQHFPLAGKLSEMMKTGHPSEKERVQVDGSIWDMAGSRQQALYIIVPITIQDALVGSIGIARSLSPLFQNLRQAEKTILVYLLFNVLLLTLIGFFRIMKLIVQPIERMAAFADSVELENDWSPFPPRQSDEFSRLHASLNKMVSRIQSDKRQLHDTVTSLEKSNEQLAKTGQEMVRTEKLAAVGRLSAGLAHEIGNPIGIIQGYLELLQKNSISDDNRLQYSSRAIAELNRINLLIRRLLDFSRTASPGKLKIDINNLTGNVVDLLKNQKKMENIRFENRLNAKQPVIETDEEGLRQVLLNMLLNAVDAIREKGPDFTGKISITTENTEEDGNKDLTITIRDNGCGITPEDLDNIFDPFFTTKEPGKGTGLGLSVSHSIIEAASGRIEAASTPGIGSEIKIILPVPEEGR